ncbi:MAG: hypothetical protein AAFY46_04595, partial [Planctomycetota bacterium]
YSNLQEANVDFYRSTVMPLAEDYFMVLSRWLRPLFGEQPVVLGYDETKIPALATERAALVTSLGDRIERVRTAQVPVVLCMPGFGCDTAAVYHAFDDAPVTLDESGVSRLASAGDARSPNLFNDLFEPARRVEPELVGLWEQLKRAAGRAVFLSGSGSTMFIVADDGNHARSLAESLGLHVPGAAFVATTTEDPSQ